jgi:hypothetical protein
MKPFFDSLGAILTPEFQHRSATLSRDPRFARAEFLSERPFPYMHWWRLDCYPRESAPCWTRLTLLVSMFFVDRRFVIGARVEWHFPFQYGDAKNPRSRAEYSAGGVWGREDLGLETYARSCQSSFVCELPALYEAFQKAVDRGKPDGTSILSEPAD